jgi:hypothetical protein
MSRDPIRAATQFFGGRVCLDFANTMDWRTSDAPQELVPDYAALLSWSKARGILPAQAVTKLRNQAVRKAADAVAVIRDAHALRTEIWRAADALCRGRHVDLEFFNRMLADVPAQPRLVRDGKGYVTTCPASISKSPYGRSCGH